MRGAGAGRGGRKRQCGKAVPDGNSLLTTEDHGLTRKQIHEVRQTRDARAELRPLMTVLTRCPIQGGGP